MVDKPKEPLLDQDTRAYLASLPPEQRATAFARIEAVCERVLGRLDPDPDPAEKRARTEADEAQAFLHKIRGGPSRAAPIPRSYEAWTKLSAIDAAALDAAHPELDPRNLPTEKQLADARRGRR